MELSTVTPCGGDCAPCPKKRSGFCAGCIPEKGLVPEWKESGGCPIFRCALAHGVGLCGLCGEFPCEKLPKIAFWEPDIVKKQTALARAFRLRDAMEAAGIELIAVHERPELLPRAAKWFHEKWGAPLKAYRESMEASLSGGPVPRWYLALMGPAIVGGLGVIENDFHDRPDLAPNVCAVYTEEALRGRGVAGALLERACRDMAQAGITTLYLLTDHTGFYERYGWEFFCMAQGEGEEAMSRMYRKVTPP